MSVGAIGSIGSLSSSQSVYSVLSPYLNGVVRTSNAAQAAQVDSVAQTSNPAVAQSAIAANGNATAAATAFSPFANPAITNIGVSYALGQSLGSQSATTPDALLSSQTLNGAASSPFSVSNQNTLTAFNTINTSNSISTLNTLETANTANSLTNTTTLNDAALTSINTATTTPLDTLQSFSQQNSIAALNAQQFSLSGDSGTLIQSYGAVALATSPVALQATAQAATPVIPPTAIVTAPAPIQAVV